MPLLSIRVSQWESFRAWGTLLAICAYNTKAENSVEFSAFEPRSGEGAIRRRDGTSARLPKEVEAVESPPESVARALKKSLNKA